MKIRIHSVTIDGLGPFRDKQHALFDESDKIVVLAPNGHGKTSFIDILRWLIQGPGAVESFRSLKPREILNRERHSAFERGSASAVLDVEGRGMYEVTESLHPSEAGDKLEVKKFNRESYTYEPVTNPAGIMLDLFPPERIGFNLLTGEHIQEFQQELNGPQIKRFIERLLHFPEIATAKTDVENLYSGLQDEVKSRQGKAQKQGRAQADLDSAQQELSRLEKRKKELETNIKKSELEQSTIDKKIGALAGQTVSAERLESQRTAVDRAKNELLSLQQRQGDAVVGLWRPLVVALARQKLSSRTNELEQFEKKYRDWISSGRVAQEFKDLLIQDECICLRPIDADARKRLTKKIQEIQGDEPLPVVPLMNSLDRCRRWLAGSQLKTDLKGVVGFSADIDSTAQRVNNLQADLSVLLANNDEDASSQLIGLESDRAKVSDNLSGDRRRLTEVEVKIKAQESLIQNHERKAGGRDTILASLMAVRDLAGAYSQLFANVLDQMIPEYRDLLESEVQSIFRDLYQKDSGATVRFDENSYLPHVRLPNKSGKLSDKAALSEGERLRLGLALLLGLRRVASEQPFLVLDAPFSALDDEGIERLLSVLTGTDSQVLILTKNRFAGNQYQMILDAAPLAFKMDWVPDRGGGHTKGHTVVAPSTIAELKLEASS